MKKYIYMMMALAATMFTACNSDDDIQSNENESREFTIIASLPQDQVATTRVVATDNSDVSSGTYGMSFKFTLNEYFRFYYRSSSQFERTNRPAKDVSPTDGGPTASFSLSTAPGGENYYVYASNIQLGSDSSKGSNDTDSPYGYFYLEVNNCIYNNLTDVQTNNPLFGVVKYTTSTTFASLNFKNVCSLVRFDITLPEGVTSITGVDIYGYNTSSENLVFGKNLKVTGSDGSAVFVDETITYGEKSRSTRSSNHYAISGKSFTVTENKLTLYAIMIPQTINGLYVQLNDGTHTYTKSKKFTSAATLEAGTMYGVKLTYTAADE